MYSFIFKSGQQYGSLWFLHRDDRLIDQRNNILGMCKVSWFLDLMTWMGGASENVKCILPLLLIELLGSQPSASVSSEDTFALWPGRRKLSLLNFMLIHTMRCNSPQISRLYIAHHFEGLLNVVSSVSLLVTEILQRFWMTGKNLSMIIHIVPFDCVA